MAHVESSLVAQMRAKLLRGMDRRDPWDALDLLNWLRFHFPEYLQIRGDDERAAAEFAKELADELSNDPAFPLIELNLRMISDELGKRP
ncbi:hypothetical protein HFO58_10915 [Rhizobium leguminosarum]|uniref:hypothetical protein n=1 Tax=Rhizobium leguminosarum TaxID=384 RepID=UPI001C94311B|nr:hypothetical protein [Rhizobium leguminosarum]MBY5533668.1 hypothetical protein [Rhizobium leguminosarum]